MTAFPRVRGRRLVRRSSTAEGGEGGGHEVHFAARTPHSALRNVPRQRPYPPQIRTLFFLCGVFVVLPFFDVPFIGLSATAPLILPVMYYAFFLPATPWFYRYRYWIMIALAIWLGIVASFVANGPWFGAREFEAIEIAQLIRYMFWLTVFLVTAYVASDFRIQRRLPLILGTAVVVLAGLRCFEGIVLGKIGAWSNTVFTTQNNYGILFSTFTPFLFPVLLGRRFTRKLLCAAGLFAVLVACAINGSRGSWICIALALAVFGGLTLASRPTASLRLVLPLAFAALALVAIFAASSRVRGAVLSRFSTFDDLEKDKSFMARRALNQKSWRLVSESPAFGVGPGRFKEVYVSLDMPEIFSQKVEAHFNKKSAHNSYLSFLAEGGIVGALPLTLLLGVLAVRGSLAAATLNRIGEGWALGVYASFIGMSVHFWALSGLTGTHAWFVYGLLAATIVLAAGVGEKRSMNPARPRVVRQRLAFVTPVVPS